MSTGYGWEGLRQVCTTMLGARHVPERLCGGFVYLGRVITNVWPYLSRILGGRRSPNQVLSRECTAATAGARVSTWLGDCLRAGKPSRYV